MNNRCADFVAIDDFRCSNALNLQKGHLALSVIRYDIRRALSLGSILSIIIVALVLIFDNEASSLFIKFRHNPGMLPDHPVIATGAAFLLGMGLGSQITLFLANRKRLNAVFHPNLGRIICAFFLALLAPISQFWAIPIPFLIPVVEAVAELFQGSLPRPMLGWACLAFLVVALPAAYVFSSLIISGVQSRIVRIALFGQAWTAAYGAVVLVIGFYTGNL